MHLPTALAIAALVASILLVMQLKQRLFAGIAVAVSGVEVLLALHVLHFGVRGVNLVLVLGAALAIAGGIVWSRSGGKTNITAATVVTLVGLIQVFSGLF
jgi:hypothetical protein